jgi:hypothetical protein
MGTGPLSQKASPKPIKPEQVIPFEEEDFNDF